MILIAGGTGRLGSLVANHLSEDHDVRVLSRGLVAPREPLDDRVEQVFADVRDPGSLGAAFDGVDVVVSAVQGFVGAGGVTPQNVDRQGNIHLIEAAERAGADVVLMSVTGAAPDSPMELFRLKHDAEERLRRSSVAWTIIRAEAFTEQWARIVEDTAGTSQRPMVFGRGDNPISWVSVHDVAALVERAVTDRSLRGRTLDICGPDPTTLRDFVQLVMRHRGWQGAPRAVPRPMLHVMANTVGRMKPEMGRQARAALAMDVMPTSNDAATRAEFPDLPRTPVAAALAGT